MSGQPETITVHDLTVTVLRSDQRRKTASLEFRNGHYILRVPAGLAAADLERMAGRLVDRLGRRQRQQTLNGDGALRRRADELNRSHFGGTLRLDSIRYVTNQRRCYGSCTPSRRSIRISDQVAGLPEWVRDYVLMHELAHLVEPNHSPAFWTLVNRYPLTERARGYLMALDLHEAGRADLPDDGGEAVDGAEVY